MCLTNTFVSVLPVGVVLQGEADDELPEKVLFCMTMNKMDLVEQLKATKDAVFLHTLLQQRQQQQQQQQQSEKVGEHRKEKG